MSSTSQVMAMGEGFAWGLHPGSLWCSAGVLLCLGVAGGGCRPALSLLCVLCALTSSDAQPVLLLVFGSLTCVNQCQLQRAPVSGSLLLEVFTGLLRCQLQWPAAAPPPSRPCYTCCPNSHGPLQSCCGPVRHTLLVGHVSALTCWYGGPLSAGLCTLVVSLVCGSVYAHEYTVCA